jgi:hypothetical protein
VGEAESLKVAVWTAESFRQEKIELRCFTLGGMDYQTPMDWSRQKTGRREGGLWLSGLKEALACLVPEVAFMNDSRRDEALRLYFLRAPSARTERALENALLVWLDTLYGKDDARSDRIRQISHAARNSANWQSCEVSTRLRQHSGACPDPQDRLLFDALTAHTVAAIASRKIRFSSGDNKILVAQTPDSNLYHGAELVAFPPDTDGHGGYWAYVLTVSAATFPEKPGINLVIRCSVRNWRAIARPDFWNADARSLDLFIPPVGAGSDWSGYRHSSFAFYARANGRAKPPSESASVCDLRFKYHRVNEAVLKFIGMVSDMAGLDIQSLLSPNIVLGRLCTLPRASSGSGDRNLPGGTGVPFPDRGDMARALDAPLGAAGLEREAQLNRAKGGLVKLARTPAGVALLRALKANDEEDPLSFYVFQIRDSTAKTVADALTEYLGKTAGPAQPVEDSEGAVLLRWPEGLAIRITPAPAGLLSEALLVRDIPLAEREGLTDEQRETIAEDQGHDLVQKAIERMRQYVVERRGGSRTPACAILEMPGSLRGRRDDPYLSARRALAMAGCVTQVILNFDGQLTNDGEDPAEKMKSAVRDCLRMLGVAPDVLPNLSNLRETTLAAFGVVRRNSENILDRRREPQTFPVAVRLRSSVIECILLGEPNWMPYAQAMLKILSGDYARFDRSRKPQTTTTIERFYADVLRTLNVDGRTIVMVERESSDVSTFDNGNLTFDSLKLAGMHFTPRELPNVSIVRTSTDENKLPFYYPEGTDQWKSGLWSWPGQQRTFYGLKAKPPSARPQAQWLPVPRVPGAKTNRKARASAQVDEICVMFMGEGGDARQIARLVHRSRATHVQYAYSTRRPFPLHEALLLGSSVTF